MPAKRTFKSMGDFKPIAAADAEKGEALMLIPGGVEVRDRVLLFSIPLQLQADQVNIYEEKMINSKDGSESMVPKGNLGISLELPEGLELSVTDPETSEVITYRIKQGGLAKTRRLYFGFDPTKGYIHRTPTSQPEDVSEANA